MGGYFDFLASFMSCDFFGEIIFRSRCISVGYFLIDLCLIGWFGGSDVQPVVLNSWRAGKNYEGCFSDQTEGMILLFWTSSKSNDPSFLARPGTSSP